MVEPLMEADGTQLDTLSVLKRRVEADLNHAHQLIEAAGGSPRVTGLGGGKAGATHSGRRRSNAFRDFLRESGDIPEKLPEGKSEDDLITEMVREGAVD
jgi:hypothetical protein